MASFGEGLGGNVEGECNCIGLTKKRIAGDVARGIRANPSGHPALRARHALCERRWPNFLESHHQDDDQIGRRRQPKMLYVRADGQKAGQNPVLRQQYEMDATVCLGEMQKANLSGVTFADGSIAGAIAAGQRSDAAGQVARGCMASKGYVLVPEDQADQKAAELASINAQKSAAQAKR
jgi:hypothetical protein